MWVNIYSAIKTYKCPVRISKDNGWLSLKHTWSKVLSITVKRLLLGLEPFGWGQILASLYPKYETSYKELKILWAYFFIYNTFNMRMLWGLEITNLAHNRLRKWQHFIEIARTSLPSSALRAISTPPDIHPSRLISWWQCIL